MKNPYCGTRLYDIWACMKKRCYNENNIGYHNYGGRGIKVCDEWQRSLPFCEWAMANGYKDDLTIDRIDVNGNYCPENCRFIPFSSQGNNRRDTRYLTAFGETKSRKEWADDPRCTVSYNTIKKRQYRGWDDEKAITTPERINRFA